METDRNTRPAGDNEQLFRRLIEDSFQGIFIHQDEALSFANQALAEVLGFDTPEEVLTLGSAGALVDRQDHDRFWEHKARLLDRTFEPEIYEARGVRKDGSRVWLEFRTTRIEWHGGHAMQCIVVDVSDRKQTEQALLASRRRFEDIARVSSDWIWETDENHILTFVSDRFTEVTGVPAEKIVGRTRREFGRKYEADWASYDEALEAKRPFYEFKYSTYYEETDQRRYWIISGTPVFDANGVFTGYRGTGRERTAEVQARKALEESERQFRDLIEGSLQGIYIHRDRKILFANSALADIFGYENLDEVLELEHSGKLFDSEEQQRLEQFTTVHRTGQFAPAAFVARGRRKDGASIWVEIRMTATGWKGEPAMQCVVADVTDRKEAEEELIDRRDHLQELVDLATQELKANAQELEEALAKEKEMTELQRQFISVASHEFRTPLAIIDGAVQRLLRRKDKLTTDELETRVNKIRSAVVTMTTLMESTLSASRLDAGRIQVTPCKCIVAEVVQAVCERQQEIRRDVELEWDLADLPRHIRADPTALDQIVTNLLSNAVKYSPENPKISVRGWTEGEYVLVSVTDSGVGISEDELPQMFSRFFRATTAAGIPGTGIGLNLVKALVELHDGSVTVESVEGEGSTFTVRLPLEGPACDELSDRELDMAGIA